MSEHGALLRPRSRSFSSTSSIINKCALAFLSISPVSILGCPIARKRRAEEAEAEQEPETERPASKRKSHPLKLTLDDGFSAESDASSEAEGDGERDGENRSKSKEDEDDMEAAAEEEKIGKDLIRGQTNGQVGKTLGQQTEEEDREEAAELG